MPVAAPRVRLANTFQLGSSPQTTATAYHIYLRTHEAGLFGQTGLAQTGDTPLLNAVGQIAADEWLRTAQAYQNIRLDRWRVLPDGIRAVVIVDSRQDN
ncbi:MAG: hypothetical protein F6J97_19225, partial [Leptolyngbya sp. SIO4C1]|nr:hypothetical protein [Leptolyngbya sp. SIO4C1]